MTRDFLGMGFFGGRNVDSENRSKFFEEWDKMPDSEKLAIVNKRVQDFKEGVDCKKNRFSVEHIDAHCEEWMSKTTEEKEKFVQDLKKTFEQRHEMMKEWKERFSHHGFGFHGRGRGYSNSTEE